MASIEVTVTHPAGLHARPATEFVKLAASYPCDIEVRNLTTTTGPANAKSILTLLTLGIDQGHKISIEAHGEECGSALLALRELIESNFGEE